MTFEELEQLKQFIADLYHCSDCWGHPMTDNDMFLSLTEYHKQKGPDDYTPNPALAHECAAYWNKLCEVYPG